jgi:MoCo/4Fe-4S cofactor protein with predicted Tat translocation signal
MKRVFEHPPEQPNSTGRKYWRSVGELNDTPEFRGWLEREFPAGAAELEGDDLSRRSFLKFMGASMALAGFGLSGCRRPEAYLIPYSKSVEWVVPGRFVYYATNMPRRYGAMPLIAATTDGRPIKLEGNGLHPLSNGATDPLAQCSILDLYDPDRSRVFVHQGKTSSVQAFEAFMKTAREEMLANGGEGAAILVEETHSPTRDRLRAELAKQFPKLTWCLYDPLRHFNEVEATRAAFGDGLRLRPRFDRAEVILSLDGDFLNMDEFGVEATRDFTNRRRVDGPEDKMNRLYVIENRYTLTGSMADHRARCQASQIGAVAAALARKIAGAAGGAGGGAINDLLSGYPADNASRFKDQDQWLTACADDLLAARGKSLVVTGPRQPAAVHLLVQAINGALGNIGATVVAAAAPERGGAEPVSISGLAEAIEAKKVKTLFILGGNPVYNALANLNWADLQKTVPTVVRLGYYEDETSESSQWHVPAAHFLEQWGDVRASDGTYGIIQPMILPLFGGLSDLQLIGLLLGLPLDEKPDQVRLTFNQINKSGGNADQVWNAFLRDGFLPGTASAETPAAGFNVAAAKAYLAAQHADNPFPVAPAGDDWEVALITDYKIDDGRYANNGWLQEMPHPITKIAWDNAAMISPATARKLGVNTDAFHEGDYSSSEFIEIEIPGGRRIKAPVLVAPGHADNSVSIALGYGRTRTGRVGRNTGFNAYPLRTDKTSYFATGAKVRVLSGEKYSLVTTQQHQVMEGRNLVRELPIETYRQNAGFDEKDGFSFVGRMGMDAHIPANVSLYRNPPYEAQHQWGMAIDLNTCTGCNACVVACQAENNIPVVGKDQVSKGRVMHWIRIDRYYSTIENKTNSPEETYDPTLADDPQILTQPVTCHHCESAPCETVCPVNATIHTEEGLNAMAYNRCIGTRYCSNNCPYKVRRFNFFNFNERSIEPIEKDTLIGKVWAGKSQAYLGPLGKNGMEEISKLSKNPNVTVRMRGVMEKCTFCVQRIEDAKINQLQVARDSANTMVPRDSFTTACAQVCPAGAIVFGNIADPESKVSKIKAQDRDYKMLEYLNVRPRLSYQARLRNPNMRMPGAELVGNSLLKSPNNHPHEEHGKSEGGEHPAEGNGHPAGKES